MKKLNKKGFTIVELVIVIAVIAILAAVLIPTFSSVIKNANKSAAMQESKIAMEIVSMEENAQLSGVYYIVGEKFIFKYDADSGLDTENPYDAAAYTVTAGENSKYYAYDEATLKAALKAETAPTNAKYSTDISKNVYVVSAAEIAANAAE